MAWGQESVPEQDARRFAAFISYSHADAKAAASLQRKLERYRLPKHVAPADRPSTAELGRIFRDREDLAAAPSLSDAIREAIAASQALIVICSPDARASRWVAEEIALFRKLHPDRPVLAALVRGEPGDAFPDALTTGGTEPLAADLRREGDGPALGFLKIVAGVAGVPLDTLVQRDAQRRVRRVTGITLAALAAMLAMAVMTTLAITARNEAARQRASAEGLVEYMLTDLREKLKGVGRLDVMEGVNRRAMEHYRGQGDLSALSSDALERRARLLHAMGEDDDKRGDLKAALFKFRESHRVTATLLQKSPNDPSRIFAHAQSEYWIGYAAQQLDDTKSSRSAYERYAELGRRLVEIDDRNSEWLAEAAYGEQNLGALDVVAGIPRPSTISRLKRALNHFDAANTASDDRTRYDIDRSEAYAWMADAQVLMNQASAALQARDRQIRILRQLLGADSRNADVDRRLLIARISRAQILADTGGLRTAIEEAGNVYNRVSGIAKADPTNAQMQAQKRGFGFILARLLLIEGGPRNLALAKSLLIPCATLKLSADEQLMCFAVRSRMAILSGDASQFSENFSAADKVLKSIKNSGGRVRWGMDFGRELTTIANWEKNK